MATTMRIPPILMRVPLTGDRVGWPEIIPGFDREFNDVTGNVFPLPEGVKASQLDTETYILSEFNYAKRKFDVFVLINPCDNGLMWEPVE